MHFVFLAVDIVDSFAMIDTITLLFELEKLLPSP